MGNEKMIVNVEIIIIYGTLVPASFLCLLLIFKDPCDHSESTQVIFPYRDS